MPCWFWDMPRKVLKVLNIKKVMFNRIQYSENSAMIWMIVTYYVFCTFIINIKVIKL